MNFEQLTKAELSLRLNDSDTSVLFTGARRRQAINDAAAEFADLTECLVRTSTIACSCSVTEYGLLSTSLQNSTDFIRLAADGVEYLHTDSNGYVTQLSGDSFPRRDVKWRNRYDENWRSSTTPVKAPTGYYIRKDGGQIYLGLNEPPRIGSSETAVVLVPYVQRPAAMTSSGDVPFSSRSDLQTYHAALPFYAAHKLLPLTGDTQAADAALQQFLGYVARHEQDERPKGGQHVTVGRSYYRESRRNSGGMDWREAPGFARR